MSKEPGICAEVVFQQLFFEYSRAIRNFLFYLGGDAGLAEDLAQEAFLRLWKHCQSVTYEGAKGFLFTTARRLWLDEVKHRKVVRRFEMRPVTSESKIDPQFQLEEAEFRKQLEQAIADLPEKQRIVFLLNRIEKMTYKEIGQLLGISEKAVEKRMGLALKALRPLYKKI